MCVCVQVCVWKEYVCLKEMCVQGCVFERCATQNEGGCRQVPRLPRQVPRLPRKVPRAPRAKKRVATAPPEPAQCHKFHTKRGRRRRRWRDGGGTDTESKSRAPHKDVGEKHKKHCSDGNWKDATQTPRHTHTLMYAYTYYICACM